MGRRRFAKNAAEVRHFKLVARAQNDPRGEDPDAAPLVLEPYAPPGAQRRTGLSEAELLQIPPSLQSLGAEVFGLEAPGEEGDSAEEGKASGDDDLANFGEALDADCYFPRDGYNYEQHLRRVSGGKRGGVGGVVLEAPQEKGAPKKDPQEIKLQVATNDDEAEVLRALENDDEYEELDDEDLEDIVPCGAVQPELMLWGPNALLDNDLPDLAMFRAAAAGSRMLDDDGGLVDGDGASELGGLNLAAASGAAEFQNFLAEEYGEDEIGGIEEEDIEGHVSLENCEEVLDEYIQAQEEAHKKLYSIYEPQKGIRDDVPRVIEETRAIIKKHYCREEGEESEEETSSGEDLDDESRTWDCESVLSTLSNLSNRPGKIGRIKLVAKPGPALKSVKETQGGGADESDEGEDGAVVELPDVVTTRPRGETAEERRLRKASVREMRKVCRKMKKESKEMYKNEASKLPGQQGSADVRAKTRIVKL